MMAFRGKGSFRARISEAGLWKHISHDIIYGSKTVLSLMCNIKELQWNREGKSNRWGTKWEVKGVDNLVVKSFRE